MSVFSPASGHKNGQNRASWWTAALLVLLLAYALRLSGAATHSTWSDEGWNLWVVQGSAVETILSRLAANHHPPAYFLGLAFWEQITGDSRLALRTLSIVGGVITVAAIYRAGADAFGPLAGLGAALAFTVFEQSIYYGQTVRHYGWLAMGVSLMLMLFGRYLRRPRLRLAVLYALVTAFTMYTMYLGALVAGVQGVVGLFLWRGAHRDKLRLFVAYVGAGVLLLPWLIYALPGQWHKVERGVIGGYHNSFATTPENIVRMADILLGGQLALGLGLCALAVWQIVQNRALARQSVIALSGAGLFAAMLILNVFVGILSERTLFFLLPGVVLLLGFGVQGLPGRVGVVLLAALVIGAAALPRGFVPVLNTGPTARLVAEGYSADDFVLLETGFDDVAFEHEMLQTLPPQSRTVFRSYYEYDYPDDLTMMQTLESVLAAEQRVWLVYWNVPRRMADLLESLGFTRQSFDTLPTGENDPLYTEYPVIEVSLYTRPRPDATPRQFGELFTLSDALIAPTAPAGGALHVDLWWQAVGAPDRDYSMGVYLLDAAGVTRAQAIGPQQLTTTWPPNTPIYDRHTLALPADLPAGDYTVIANVYWWETLEALPVEGEDYAVIGTVRITAE